MFKPIVQAICSIFTVLFFVLPARADAAATVLAATREIIPGFVLWGPAKMPSRCGQDLYVLENVDYFQVWSCVRWNPQTGKFTTMSTGLVDAPLGGEVTPTRIVAEPEPGSSRFVIGRSSQFFLHDANNSSEGLLAVLQNPSLTNVAGLGLFDFNGDGIDDVLLAERSQFRDVASGTFLGRLELRGSGATLLGNFSEKEGQEVLALENSLVRVLQPRTGIQLTRPTEVRIVPPIGSFNAGDDIDRAFAVNLNQRNQLLLMSFSRDEIEFRAVAGEGNIDGAIPVRWNGFQTPLIFALRPNRLDLIDPDSSIIVRTVPGERRSEVGRRLLKPVDLDGDGDEEVIFSARGNDSEVFRNPDGASFLHEAYQLHVPLGIEIEPSGGKHLLTADSGSTTSIFVPTRLPPRFSRFGIDTLDRIETDVPLGSTNFIRDINPAPGSERINLGAQGRRQLNMYSGDVIWSRPASEDIPPNSRWLVGRALPNGRSECEGAVLVDRFEGFVGIRTLNLMSGELSMRKRLSNLFDERSFAFADLNQDGVCDVSILFFGTVVAWDGATLTEVPQALWTLSGLNYAFQIAVSALNPARPVIVVFGTSQLPPSTLIVDGRNGVVQRTVAINYELAPVFDRDVVPISMGDGNNAWVWTSKNRVSYVDEMMRAPVASFEQPGYSELLSAEAGEFYVGGSLLRKIRIRLDLIRHSGFED